MEISVTKSGSITTTRLVETAAPYIEYTDIEKTGIVHNGFSTRIGGVSSGIFATMNFSVRMGDTPENVRRNFDMFLSENGFKNPVMSSQTHTTNIRRVKYEDIGKGIYTDSDFDNIDGLITDEPEITLVTSYADCVPLYFVDMKNKAIGLSHSGWRGTVKRMGEKTLIAMQEAFGTKPDDVMAAIGPSICASCYEVSEDVAGDFVKEFGCEVRKYNEKTNLSKIIPQDMTVILYKKPDNKYMLNLWAANYEVLRNAGIPKSQISIPDICTCCNEKILFSHRATNGKRGNLCAFLMLKKP